MAPSFETMLGDRCPTGPGGRDCKCCGQPPGRKRKATRRQAKRSNRQEFRREVRPYLGHSS